MMLLGAIVLVIGFLILSSLVARVSQAPAETRGANLELLREAGLAEVALQIAGATAANHNEMLAVLQHVVQLEASHGYVLKAPCPNTTATSLTATLSGAGGSVTFPVTIGAVGARC